jgi:two-component system nitrate/nitrite response regulator NarL
MTDKPIKVAILEDHQGIIDGYLYRLNASSEIKVVATAYYGEDLESMLAAVPIDVLLMDINVPAHPGTPNPFPVLHLTRRLIQNYPNLNILVISILTHQTLIQALVDLGISGYIFKQDSESIRQLDSIVPMIARGGIYFSREADEKLRSDKSVPSGPSLTVRQLEALSLCAAYPDSSTSEIAGCLDVAASTLRNLLSNAYLRLDVRTRAAAIVRLQQLGLIPPPTEGRPPSQ